MTPPGRAAAATAYEAIGVVVSQAVEFSRGGPVGAVRQLALPGEQGLLRVPEPLPGLVGGANPQGRLA